MDTGEKSKILVENTASVFTVSIMSPIDNNGLSAMRSSKRIDFHNSTVRKNPGDNSTKTAVSAKYMYWKSELSTKYFLFGNETVTVKLPYVRRHTSKEIAFT